MRKTLQTCAICSIVQLALREWWGHMRTPRSIGVFAVLGLLLVVIDPFDATSGHALAVRYTYWVVLSVATYAIGTLCTMISLRILRRLDPPVLRQSLSAALAAIPITALVILFNWLIGAAWVSETLDGSWVLKIWLVATTIGFVITQLRPAMRPKPPAAPNRSDVLISKLPIDKWGQLISISAQDHYIELRTDRGHDLILMRFSDALGYVAAEDGLQVHRSHWVNLAAIQSVRKGNSTVVLIMQDGHEIPVSRSYLPSLKAHGIL